MVGPQGERGQSKEQECVELKTSKHNWVPKMWELGGNEITYELPYVCAWLGFVALLPGFFCCFFPATSCEEIGAWRQNTSISPNDVCLTRRSRKFGSVMNSETFRPSHKTHLLLRRLDTSTGKFNSSPPASQLVLGISPRYCSSSTLWLTFYNNVKCKLYY